MTFGHLEKLLLRLLSRFLTSNIFMEVICIMMLCCCGYSVVLFRISLVVSLLLHHGGLRLRTEGRAREDRCQGHLLLYHIELLFHLLALMLRLELTSTIVMGTSRVLMVLLASLTSGHLRPLLQRLPHLHYLLTTG